MHVQTIISIESIIPSSVIAVLIEIVGDFCRTASKKHSIVVVSSLSQISHATGIPMY